MTLLASLDAMALTQSLLRKLTIQSAAAISGRLDWLVKFEFICHVSSGIFNVWKHGTLIYVQQI